MERNHFFPTGEEEHEVITPLEMTAIPKTPVDLSQVWTIQLQTPAIPEIGEGTFSEAYGAHLNTLTPKLESVDKSQVWTTPLPMVAASEIAVDDISKAVTSRIRRIRPRISQPEPMPMEKLVRAEIATDVTQANAIS